MNEYLLVKLLQPRKVPSRTVNILRSECSLALETLPALMQQLRAMGWIITTGKGKNGPDETWTCTIQKGSPTGKAIAFQASCHFSQPESPFADLSVTGMGTEAMIENVAARLVSQKIKV